MEVEYGINESALCEAKHSLSTEKISRFTTRIRLYNANHRASNMYALLLIQNTADHACFQGKQ